MHPSVPPTHVPTAPHHARPALLRRALWCLGLLACFCLLACEQRAEPQCSADADCQQGKRCLEGVCGCPAPLLQCGDQCVDVRRSNAHCGACSTSDADTACPAGKSCLQGRCQCPEGQRDCPGGDSCVDTQTNVSHCGGCGSACADGQLCANGRCVSKCPDATPTVCDQGCIDTNTDNLHCGKCGNPCTNGTSCFRGKCVCPAGQQSCDSGGKTICVDPLSDKLHCGKCGNACSQSQLCAAGKCLDECPSATPTICFGGCVDAQSNNEHCGKCGTECKGGKRCVQAICTCLQGKSSCDGTCINPRYTRDHCGKCGNKCADGKVCADGRCLNSCPRATQTVCFGGCVQLDKNIDHCGKCGNACLLGQVCTAGKCECPKGKILCGDQCIDPQSNPDHCGGCDKACKAAEVCGAGQCGTSCPSATPTDCARACINTKDNADHCGACGKACLPGQLCKDSKCACEGNQIICDGQCFDTQSSNSHCGTCGNACEPGTECVSGTCALICPDGETVCNTVCTDLNTSDDHCGTCGNACQGRKGCDKGKCVCPGQLEECDNACIDTQTNIKHCGGCGKACKAGERCVKGECQLACPVGQTICSGQCINTQTDSRHCGACGTACAADQLCDAGKCVCPSGQTLCGSSCVYTSFDAKHCGACGNACGTGQYCISGKCEQCSTNTTPCGTSCCGAGTTCCSGQCVVLTTNPQYCSSTTMCGTACQSGEACCNGTCTDLNTNAQSCGACGNACQSGETCCNRSCVADLQSNNQHCGACGNACKSDETCCSGTCTKTNTNQACGSCTTACQTGQSCCTSGATTSCVDVQNDDNNCGACGTVCKSNEKCCGGTCTDIQANAQACGACTTTCQTGNPDCCSGACTNKQSNSQNCGTCGNACSSGTSCCGGACKNLQQDVTACGSCTNKCLPGSSCCSGVCADFQRDRINCGKCGTVCPSSEICFKGLCRCVPYFYETCGNNRDDDCDGVADNPEVCNGHKPPSSFTDYAVLANEDKVLITRTSPVTIACYKADNTVIKAPFDVETGLNTSTHYSTSQAIITHPKANRFVVAWIRQNRTSPYPRAVYFRLFDLQCNPLTTMQKFNTTEHQSNWYGAAMTADGSFAILYRTSNQVPTIKFYSATGTLLKQEDVDGATTKRCNNQYSTMRVAMNSAGAGLITCHNRNQSTPIYYRRFNSSRSFVDPAFVELTDSAGGNAGRSHSHNIGINDNGQFAFQWQNWTKGTNEVALFNSNGTKRTTFTLSTLVETASNGFYYISETIPVIGSDFVFRDTPSDSRRNKRWYRYTPTGTLVSGAAREYNFPPYFTRYNGKDVFVVNTSLQYLIQKLDLATGKGVCSGKVCVCKPNSTILCSNYNFGSRLRNQCHYGTRKCAADGLSYGTCVDFGLPISEVCGNQQDDDCDGRIDDNCNIPNAHTFLDSPTDYAVAGDGTKFYIRLSGYTLLGHCLRADGTPLRQPWVISTQSFSSNHLLAPAKGSGKFYLSWIDRSDPSHTKWRRYLQVYDKNCQEIGTQQPLTLYNDYSSYADYRVADNGHGAYAYADQSRHSYLQFLDDKGQAKGATIKIDTRTKCYARLRLAINSTTGDGIVLCGASNSGIFYQRFNANGTMKDTQLVLVAGSANSSISTAAYEVGMNRKGQFVIAWIDRTNKQFKANFYKADATLAKPTFVWSTSGRNYTSLSANYERIVLLGDDFVLRDNEYDPSPTWYRYTPAGVLKSKDTPTNTRLNRYYLRSDDLGSHFMPESELLRINPLTLP